MKENFPNLVKEIYRQVQEAQRVPNKLDPKRTTPKHIIIKMSKVNDKETTIKAARKKAESYYKGVPIRQSTGKRDWQEVFKVMKSKDLHPR